VCQDYSTSEVGRLLRHGDGVQAELRKETACGVILDTVVTVYYNGYVVVLGR